MSEEDEFIVKRIVKEFIYLFNRKIRNSLSFNRVLQKFLKRSQRFLLKNKSFLQIRLKKKPRYEFHLIMSIKRMKKMKRICFNKQLSLLPKNIKERKNLISQIKF
jgi:hypothetical protein